MPDGHVLAEDVLGVLTDPDLLPPLYRVVKMADAGVVLMSGRHDHPVLLPYSDDYIPAEVVARILSHCPFSSGDFWSALEAFKAKTAPEGAV